MSLYIVQLEEMKRDLGLTDPQDDANLSMWMTGLQDRFEDYCHRKFLRSTSEVEIFDGDTTSLFLRRYPVETIATVHIDVDQDWDADSLLTSDDYLLNAARGALLYGRGTCPWPEGNQHIRVAYTGGYVAAGQAVGDGQTAMPDSLRRAFVMQMGFEWRNRTNLGKQSASAQGYSINLAPAKFLDEVVASLQKHRRYL